MRFTAAVMHDEAWYVARCLEVEVTSQGRTVEEAIANLKEALELYFEDKVGLVEVTQRGSHVKLRGAGGWTVIVPVPELARGTLRSILRRAGISPEAFAGLL